MRERPGKGSCAVGQGAGGAWGPAGERAHLPAILPAMFWNMAEALVPSAVTAPMMTVAMSAAIRPYSSAVTPLRSVTRLRAERYRDVRDMGPPSAGWRPGEGPDRRAPARSTRSQERSYFFLLRQRN